VAKHAQHVAPNNIALACCGRLAGALLAERLGRTGECSLEVMAIGTERSEFRTTATPILPSAARAS